MAGSPTQKSSPLYQVSLRRYPRSTTKFWQFLADCAVSCVSMCRFANSEKKTKKNVLVSQLFRVENIYWNCIYMHISSSHQICEFCNGFVDFAWDFINLAWEYRFLGHGGNYEGISNTVLSHRYRPAENVHEILERRFVVRVNKNEVLREQQSDHVVAVFAEHGNPAESVLKNHR